MGHAVTASPADNLRLANRRRREQAELRARLRRREVKIGDVLRDDLVRKMPLELVLLWAPRIGPSVAKGWVGRARARLVMPASTTNLLLRPCGDLTDREVEALLAVAPASLT